MPIPAKSGISYNDIHLDSDHSYLYYLEQLTSTIKLDKIKYSMSQQTKCHLDPDIRYNSYKRKVGWMPIFGQVDIAQRHLEIEKVKVGDIFLFFGLFQKTIFSGNQLIFNKSQSPIHLIYGFLQIGKIHLVDNNCEVPDWMDYHPHASKHLRSSRWNTVYEAASRLSFDSNLPGAGNFRYSKSLVLTKEGYSTSQWNLPDFFKNLSISYHPKGSKYGWKGEYFQSALKGQEFVIEECEVVSNWAKTLIGENIDVDNSS